MKAARRLLPALLALCLLLCGCTGDEAAAPAETGPAPAAVPARTPAPERPPYQELPVYMDGLLIDRGCVRGHGLSLPGASFRPGGASDGVYPRA